MMKRVCIGVLLLGALLAVGIQMELPDLLADKVRGLFGEDIGIERETLARAGFSSRLGVPAMEHGDAGVRTGTVDGENKTAGAEQVEGEAMDGGIGTAPEPGGTGSPGKTESQEDPSGQEKIDEEGAYPGTGGVQEPSTNEESDGEGATPGEREPGSGSFSGEGAIPDAEGAGTGTFDGADEMPDIAGSADGTSGKEQEFHGEGQSPGTSDGSGSVPSEEDGSEPEAFGHGVLEEDGKSGGRDLLGKTFLDPKEIVEGVWDGIVSVFRLGNAKDDYYNKQKDYVHQKGCFYLFLRKKGDKVEKGKWYKIAMSLPSKSSYQSQKITWDILYLDKQYGKVANISDWTWKSKPSAKDPFSFQIEKGKSWEKTRQNGSGADPVLGNVPGVPEHTDGYYFKLCGKLLYDYPGYQIQFDDSIYKDLEGFDIEYENKQIQKKDKDLKEGEESWTGNGYFKFAIDTNNTGMTNYGASHTFHNSVYGFNLRPNQYTIVYKPNGGKGDMKATDVAYDQAFSLRKNQFERVGYSFAGWDTKAAGGGTHYKNKESGLRNLTKENGKSIKLYAQWKPKTYRVGLEHQLTSPQAVGTEEIFEKYGEGWYLDKSCKSLLAGKSGSGQILLPKKKGYQFLGYYSAKKGGVQMIDRLGKLTPKGVAGYKRSEDTVWYAQYKYQISCEDYVDIPCDMDVLLGESREEVGILLSYDKDAERIFAKGSQTGCEVHLCMKDEGTRIGQFVSGPAHYSGFSTFGHLDYAYLCVVPEENAAYQLMVFRDGKTLCDRTIYFKNGRFRTLIKLKELPKVIEKGMGERAAGEEWGTKEAAYPLYRYTGCSTIQNVKSPGTVERYFTYQGVNIVYDGNGATEGKHMAEYDVSFENLYQFRENVFSKKILQRGGTEDEKHNARKTVYAFQGWKLAGEAYQPGDKIALADLYGKAKSSGKLLSGMPELKGMFQVVTPIPPNGFGAGGLGKADTDILDVPYYATEYIHLQADWNAVPTIEVKPGERMEFYEGEEIKKEDLVSRLDVYDEEDGDLSAKLQIKKISYPASRNKSQKAYVATFEHDVTEGFRLYNYYKKLSLDETVSIQVLCSVTDSNGNTAQEEIMVKIKYNHYPKIQCEDVYYYTKEEANRGEITKEAVLSYAKALDVEDGDITRNMTLEDFDPEKLRLQTEAKAEFLVTYQVTDAYQKTSEKTVTLVVWDEGAATETPRRYVRYISKEYIDTLEEGSVWREPGNDAYLKGILGSEEPMETWKFSHEEVLAVQAWMTGGGKGSWKVGQEANRSFLAKFAGCRKR